MKEFEERLLFLASVQEKVLIPVGLAVLLIASPIGFGGNTPLAILLRNSLILILLTLGLVTSRRDSKVGLSCGIERLLLPFFLLCALSYIFSPYKFSTQIEIFQIFLYTGFFYLLFNMLSGSLVKRLFWVVIVGSCLQAGLAVIQHFFHHVPRAPGLFLNPNLAATYMLAGFSLTLASIGNRGSPFLGRAIPIGCLVLLTAGMVSTGSRSLVVSLPLVVLVWALIHKRRLWKGLTVGILLCSALILVPNPVGERWIHGRQRDVYAFDRLKIWSQTLRILKDHPFVGVTLGNYEYSTFRYRFPSQKDVGRYEKIFKDAHNSYLEIAAEVGLLGSALLLGMIFVVVKRFFRAYKIAKTVDPEAEYHLRSSLLLLTALAGQAFFHDVAHSPPNVILGLFALGTGLNEGLKITKQSLPYEKTDSKWKNLLLTIKVKRPFLLYISIVLVVFLWPFFCLRVYLANNYYQKALEKYAEGKLEDSKVVLTKAIFYNQNQPYYHKLLGDVFMRKFEERGNFQNLKRAATAFMTAVRLNTLDPELYYNLGNFYHYLEKKMPGRLDLLEKGIQYYKEAIARDPFRIRFRMRLALSYIELERLKEARDQLEKCLELEPQFLAAMYLLRQVYEQMGNQQLKDKMTELLEITIRKYQSYRPRSKYEKMILSDPRQYFLEYFGTVL